MDTIEARGTAVGFVESREKLKLCVAEPAGLPLREREVADEGAVDALDAEVDCAAAPATRRLATAMYFIVV